MDSLMRPSMVNDEVSFEGASVRVAGDRELRIPRAGVLAAAPAGAPARGGHRCGVGCRRRRLGDRTRRATVRARMGAACLYPRRLLPQRTSLRDAVARDRILANRM